jgi:hypothetical protein
VIGRVREQIERIESGNRSEEDDQLVLRAIAGAIRIGGANTDAGKAEAVRRLVIANLSITEIKDLLRRVDLPELPKPDNNPAKRAENMSGPMAPSTQPSASSSETPRKQESSGFGGVAGFIPDSGMGAVPGARESEGDHSETRSRPSRSGRTPRTEEEDNERETYDATWAHGRVYTAGYNWCTGFPKDAVAAIKENSVQRVPIATLVAWAGGDDEYVRCGAILALGEFATRTKPVLTAIEAAQKDKNPAIRRAANSALTKVKSRASK